MRNRLRNSTTGFQVEKVFKSEAQRISAGIFISACLVLSISNYAVAEPLPEGNTGIASQYPNDSGIDSDPSVLFADDFETYGAASNLGNQWDQVFHLPNIRIATEAQHVFGGGKSVELSVPQQNSEVSNNLVKAISPNEDVLFLRYYSKYNEGFDVLGSSHNGSTMSGKYCCPGVPADGYNKFVASLEVGRFDRSVANPGQLNIYIYHPEQRDIWGDHFYPTGRVLPFDKVPGDFGPDFVPRPDVTPELGRWYSYEMMVRLNTPGQRDGRIAVWLDGKLVADFLNLRIRETTSLKIDQLTLDLHVNGASSGTAKKWYDNVVVARSYIGPVFTSATARPNPPTNLQISN